MTNIEKALSLFKNVKEEKIFHTTYYVVWTSQNGKYNISLFENHNNKVRIKVDDSWLSDFPIMYNNVSWCVYDNPYLFPAYVKDKVNVVARKLRNKGLF